MTYDLVAMGASWGGLHAVETVLSGLPDGFRTPIAIAQHRAVVAGSGALARMLSLRSGVQVREAGDKDPSGFALSIEEQVQHSRPSIDVLFDSAADTYGESLIGVILTGANHDGAYGLTRVKRRGGVTIAQDPATAERRDMPAAAIATGVVDHVLALEEIGPKLGELVAA